jgi:hypothetical protein
MRSNVICSFAAVFAAFTQFAAVFAAFALPVPATADQPTGAMGKVSVTQEQNVREVAEVIVEVRRAI